MLARGSHARVMIIIDTAFLGGPGKGLLQLLRHEHSNRFNFIICTFARRNPKSTEFIDAMRSAGHDLRVLSQRFRFDPQPMFEAAKIASHEKIDLVQSHGYKAHVVASHLARRLRLPWFAMAHGWTWENWKVRLYNQVERVLLKKPDIAAAVSTPLVQELRSIRGADRPSRLILNAVDPAEIRGSTGGPSIRELLRIPRTQVVLGIFGRMSPEKGIVEAYVAFERAFSDREDVSLLYVGDGALRSALRTRIENSTLRNRVILAGYQTSMRDYYEAIDLLVIPSLSEGLPNVLLEAMSLGVPALCTRVGAIPDVIDDGVTGWLVNPGDTDQLAVRMRDVVDGHAERCRVAKAASESLYPRFSPGTRASRFVAIYDDLLANRSCDGSGSVA